MKINNLFYKYLDMKKIISFFILFISLLNITIANENVIVSAIVWLSNHPPLVLSVIPNSDPRIIKTNKTQSYTLYFKDDEKNIITYTITAWSGFTNPISWTISSLDYDSSSWAYINFLYLSPPTSNPNESIIVTLNDWNSLITKKLNLYVY